MGKSIFLHKYPSNRLDGLGMEVTAS